MFSLKGVSWKVLLLLGLAFQLILSVLLWWRAGNIPPGFDDSYAYIFLIRKVAQFGSLIPAQVPYLKPGVHFYHLGYSMILGGMALVTGLSAKMIYVTSFFWGKIPLILILGWWCKQWFDEQEAKAAFVFTVMFIGNGGIHGFFWVTPSYWALLTLLLISGLMGKVRRISFMLVGWCLGLGWLAISFHQIAWVGIASLAGWVMLKRLRGNVDRSGVVIIGLVALGAAIFVGWQILFEHQLVIDSKAKGVLIPTEVVTPYLPDDKVGSWDRRLVGVWEEGFSLWFWFFPILLILPRIIATFRVKHRDFYLLVIASLAVCIAVGVVVDQGYRSWLWMNVLVYAFLGVSWRQTGDQFTKGVLMLFLLLMTSWNLVGLWQGRSYNAEWWDEGCLELVKEATDPIEEVYFTSQSGIATFAAGGLGDRRLIGARHIRDFGKEFLLVSETKPFEGNSDQQTITVNEVQTRAEITKVTDCGYFEIYKGNISQ